MRYFKPHSVRILLLSALAGLLTLISASSVYAQSLAPAGDLTVTVEEQENGDVKFSLSGTAYMQGSSFNMGYTNYASAWPPSEATPPSITFGSYPLPPGLTLTMPSNMLPSESDLPEEGAPATSVVYPLTTVAFSGGWHLGYFSGGHVFEGDPITGAGSVTTNVLNFGQNFIPGTFVVGPGGSNSEPEGSVAEGQLAVPGQYPYSITYNVIPYTQDPSLVLSGPVSFPRTILRRSAGSEKLTITNNGNTALNGLSLSISGTEFTSSRLPKTTLAPGESTSVDVSFRPKRKGKRSEAFTVKGLYTPRPLPRMLDSEEEGPAEAPEEEVPVVPVEVSASTQLTGQGIPAPKAAPRPNTPRFPRGAR
jgi:hypothetical protein